MTYIGPARTKGYAARAGGHAWDLTVMTAIAGAESGWNTTAKSPTDDWGLFQINRYWHKSLFRRYTWYDPADNAAMAFEVWKSQHYRAWSTYNNGAYKRYLNQSGGDAQAPAGAGGGALGPDPLGPAPKPGHDDYSATVAKSGRAGQLAAGRMHNIGNAINHLR